jgi:hypothetical protein
MQPLGSRRSASFRGRRVGQLARGAHQQGSFGNSYMYKLQQDCRVKLNAKDVASRKIFRTDGCAHVNLSKQLTLACTPRVCFKMYLV